ncbi:MAG: hypothetical protein HOP28_00010 [Gemmatimonadales bacterium]|nr:hypothetical protein [Gemmatimonadales bacterium]
MTPRSSNGEPRVRLLAGTGLYRVTAEQFATQKTPAVIALSFHAGIESAIKRWSHSTLFLGVRTITMPSVNSEWLWYFPIEIGLRLR